MKPPAIRLAILDSDQLGLRSFVARNGSLEPYFTGRDADEPDLVCGKCGFVLATRLPHIYLEDLILQCPSCESLNEVRAAG
jgi:hypothetical protein